MIIRVMRMKRLMGLLVVMASILPLSAQTELTAELVWQEGMHWVYPFEIYTDFYGAKTGVYLREFKLEKYYDEEVGDSLLIGLSRSNYKGEWSDWYPDLGRVKAEGNKVIAYWDNKPYAMYDFDTWTEGEEVDFVTLWDFPYNDGDHMRTMVLENQHRLSTDPEGKYISTAFYGTDDKVSKPYYFVKGIGRVQDNTGYNLAYSVAAGYIDVWLTGLPYDDILALKVWHPDLGVLYQHPGYERYMKIAGADVLTADEADEAVVKAGAGEVTVASSRSVEVMICTTTGVTVLRDKVTGSATYPLASGIYIVRAGSQTCKICI